MMLSCKGHKEIAAVLSTQTTAFGKTCQPTLTVRTLSFPIFGRHRLGAKGKG